jgi:hypothetical protein
MRTRTLADLQKQPPQRASFTVQRRQAGAADASGCTSTASRLARDLSQIPIHRRGEPGSPIVGDLTGPRLVQEQASSGMATTGTTARGSEDTEGKAPGQPSAEPQSDTLPGAPAACLLQAALPYSRSGILQSATGTVGEQFDVRAEWSSAPAASRGQTSYCAAECGEYHQFIRGHMLSSANKDGSNAKDVSATIFGGQPLDEKVFREDGLAGNPKARYGHRNERQTMNEKYEPDRATGPKYTGMDFPNVSIGTFADIDLTFLGKLVDTCNKTETMSSTWRVQFRGVIRP